MSREIKFAFWHNWKKEMWSVDSINWVYNEVWNGGDGANLNDGVLLQYTGLLDKNDKKIFEGDIVRVNDDQDGDRTYEVIFKEGCYWGKCIYTLRPSTTPYKTLLFDLDYWDNESKEIIGNIYENSELITGVKNG